MRVAFSRCCCLAGLTLLQIAAAAPARADIFDKPSGFDQRAWDYMTRDQKISVIAKIGAHADPLATDSQVAAIKIVKSLLKDEDSAKFRDIKRRAAFDYCGWVNAKNALGGYVGYSVFFSNDKFTVLLPSEASEPNLC